MGSKPHLKQFWFGSLRHEACFFQNVLDDMTCSKVILVAEDDPNDVFFLKRAFSHVLTTVPIRFVQDGKEVIDYLSGTERGANPLPAVIILDLVMPRVSGFEVLAWIGHNSGFSHVPCVAFSGLNAPTDIARAYSLGAKLFLLKTADVVQWANILRRVCEIYELAETVGLEQGIERSASL